MEFEIRLLSADDASLYGELRLQALEGDPDAFGSSAEEHRQLSMEDIAARLYPDPLDKFVFGAFAGKRLVGTAGFVREKNLKERHKGFVWGVYVAPEMRGKSVGRALMKQLIDRATQMEGIEQIVLSVTTTQTAAANLYRAVGFEFYGREPRALKVRGRYLDEDSMIRYLNRDGSNPAK